MSDPVSLLAGPVIDRIIEQTHAFGKKKYHQLYGVEGEIEKLTSNLSSISAVLKDAESCLADTKSHQLTDWLTKLRDAALDVEDILETFATEAAMREKQKHPSPLAWLSSRCNAANKITKTVARIEEISQEKAKFHFRVGDYGGRSWTPPSTTIGLREMSLLRDSEIIGREKEKNEIVSWLTSQDESENQQRIPVLPIVGMGGLGKTTLAQLVYNDERVYRKNSDTCHFEVAMWVNVSVDASADKILIEMVEMLTKMRHDMIPQSSIKSRILEVLDGKRFLLVLDDVWLEKLDWEPLHSFLKLCPSGSKVLVTSRNANVARVMGASRTHSLGILPEDQCWDLFAKRVFPDGTHLKDLEEIGREIIRKCAFLPLAVKAIAGILRGNNDASRWQRILKNDTWKSEKSNLNNWNPNILPALMLSYDDLPSQLKQCFAYCHMFPKGYMFAKNELVKLWIAEGYIQPSGEDKLEDAGRDYFDELFSRSFFQVLDIDDKERYKMHDLIQDLAKSVSSACQQLEENKPYTVEQNCRHVSILCKDVQKPAMDILRAHKLRTLLLPINYDRNFGVALDKIFRTLSCLRVLDLNSSNIIDLPKSIGKLKLLHYLDLSRTQISILPDTICNLHNLQTLKLLECLWLLELPKDLGNLNNLRHLELDDMFWQKFSSLPPRIGGMTNLQNLQSYHIRRESGYGIEELKRMNYLEGMLHIYELENSDNARAAELKEKESITKLLLQWSKDVDQQDLSVQETVLEDLEPHQHLQELHIYHYKGSRLPMWMGNGTLQSLQKISLKHCVNCRVLSLGPLPHLQELIIKGMSELVEWPYAEYQSLNRLKISECPKLQEVPRIFLNLKVMKIKQCDAMKVPPVMPSVKFLWLINNALLEDWHEAFRWSFMELLEVKIVNCPRFQDLPQVFFPQKLEISGCNLLRTLPNQEFSQRLQCLEIDKCSASLVEAIPSTSSLYSLVISNITDLSSLPKLPHLPQLKSLYIQNCRDLVSLFSEDGSLQNLTSLKLLCISGCRRLETFPAELPISLEYLSLQNCSKLQFFHNRKCLAGLKALKDLYLEDCPKLKSFPEDGLPSSLQHLCIRGCPRLIHHCNTGGRYWPMIEHISDLELEFIDTSEPRTPLQPKKGYFACLCG